MSVKGEEVVTVASVSMIKAMLQWLANCSINEALLYKTLSALAYTNIHTLKCY